MQQCRKRRYRNVQWAVTPGWARMPNFPLWTSSYCWFSSLFVVKTWLDEYLRLTGYLSIMTSAWLQQQWWAALGRHHHPPERDPWRVYDPFESWSSITVLTLREPIVWNTRSVSLSDVLRIPWKPRSPTVCKTEWIIKKTKGLELCYCHTAQPCLLNKLMSSPDPVSKM